MSVSIKEFVSETKSDLDDFRRWYELRSKDEPNIYPIALDDDNEGEWLNMFLDFDPSMEVYQLPSCDTQVNCEIAPADQCSFQLTEKLNELSVSEEDASELKDLVQKLLATQVSRSKEALNDVYNENEMTGSEVIWIELENTENAIEKSLITI